MNRGFKTGGIITPGANNKPLFISGSEFYLNKKQAWELGKIAGRKEPRKSTTLKGLVKRLRK